VKPDEWILESEADPHSDYVMAKPSRWEQLIARPVPASSIQAHLDDNWMVDSITDDGFELVITVRLRPNVERRDGEMPRRRFRRVNGTP